MYKRQPYAPIRCELQLNNAIGEPIPGKLSVSIRDAVRSDYMEYDNNIFTDLLLTSDLKGYIHQPGYYFTESSLRKQKELDILLMVHGWRKYDMTQQIGISPFTPLQLPESQLVLYGQVKSTILKNKLKDIALSVMVKRDAETVSYTHLDVYKRQAVDWKADVWVNDVKVGQHTGGFTPFYLSLIHI